MGFIRLHLFLLVFLRHVDELCEGSRIGDGKIFVRSVEQVIRIRTGEIDEAAV